MAEDDIADKLKKSMERAEERFWLEDPKSLFKSFHVFPMSDMTEDQRYNSLTRGLIVIVVILLVLKNKWWSYTLAAGLLVITLLYYLNRRNTSHREGFDELITPIQGNRGGGGIRMHGPDYTADGLARLSRGESTSVARYGLGSGRNYICNQVSPPCQSQSMWRNDSGLVSRANLGQVTPYNIPKAYDQSFRAGAEGFVPIYSDTNEDVSPDIYDSDPTSPARRMGLDETGVSQDTVIRTGLATPKRQVGWYENPTSLNFDSPYDDYDSPGWSKGSYEEGGPQPTHIYDPTDNDWRVNINGVQGSIDNSPKNCGNGSDDRRHGGSTQPIERFRPERNGGLGERTELAMKFQQSGSMSNTEAYEDCSVGGADRWEERQQTFRPLNDTRRATRQGYEMNSRQGVDGGVQYYSGPGSESYEGVGWGGEVYDQMEEHSGGIVPLQSDYLVTPDESSFGGAIGMNPEESENQECYDRSPLEASQSALGPDGTFKEYVAVNNYTGVTTEAQRYGGIGLYRGQAHQIRMQQQASHRESMEGAYRNLFRSKRSQCTETLGGINGGLTFS